MATSKRKKAGPHHTSTPRASVSFPPELYSTLEEIAKQKKVSLAWVVREAAEKYVADLWPLLRKQ
jgi:predicted DNA-binding protein